MDMDVCSIRAAPSWSRADGFVKLDIAIYMASRGKMDRNRGATYRGPVAIDILVGARIRLRRKLAGMSQDRMADAMGVSFQQLQNYETGASRVSASKLYAAAQTLEAPVAYFFEDLEALADSSLGEVIASGNPVAAFLKTSEGQELAALFPKISRAEVRRAVLDIIGAAADKPENGM